jgi:hypothetical protein
LIIRKFDETLQTKVSKIRVEEMWKHILTKCSDKSDQDKFMQQTNLTQLDMYENINLSKKMIETLDHSLRNKIEQEVFKQTLELRQSHYMDENEKLPGGKVGAASPAALDRMVDKGEFKIQLEKKASKIELENCLRLIDILNNHQK